MDMQLILVELLCEMDLGRNFVQDIL